MEFVPEPRLLGTRDEARGQVVLVVTRPVGEARHQTLQDVGAGDLQQFRRADVATATDQRQLAPGEAEFRKLVEQQLVIGNVG